MRHKHWELLIITMLITVATYLAIIISKPDLQTTILMSLNIYNSKVTDAEQIMKIGDEVIYRKDLEYEIAHYPDELSSEIDALLKNKIATDSMILQAAAADGYLQLNDEIYNSPNKNYRSRIQTIASVKSKIADDSGYVSGAGIFIWFMNNTPGPIGYEKGKELAYQTIQPIHQKVKKGEVSIKDAGEQIKSLEFLAQVDKAYKVNSYYEFKASKKDKIVFDSELNAQLLMMKEGQISELLLLQDYENGNGKVKKDAAYAFFQIFKKQNSAFNNFEEWLNQKQGKYERIDL